MNRPDEAVFAKELPGDRVAYVIPITFGRAYITVARAESDRLGIYDEVYTYETIVGAVGMLELWPGHAGTEPEGWIRHQPSNRRREEGDPAREEVRA